MTEQALPRPSRFPWLLPAVLFAVVMAALVGVILFARESSKSDAPPRPPAFVPPQLQTYTAFDVEGNDNGNLRVSSGSAQTATSSDLALPAGTRVWVMEPASAKDLQPPLKVNVIGIPNEVRNYTIKMLVAAEPAGDVSFAEPFIELFDGFYGHETSRDTRERVVLSVVLESFDGRQGVTKTANGPGTLYIDDGAPLRVVRAGAPADIEPGDRIALRHGANGQPDASLGVLVLRGGAR
jgi:hypothetical protein